MTPEDNFDYPYYTSLDENRPEMTPEEADKAYDEAPAIPFEEGEIDRIVSFVTSKKHVYVLPDDSGVFKFVRLTTGEYRFCSLYRDHDTLLRGDEKAVSAGFIHYNGKSFSIDSNDESMTLKLGPHPDDQKNIALIYSSVPTEKQVSKALDLIMGLACDNLPDGWEIEIKMRKGEAELELIDPDGETVSDDWDSDSRNFPSFIEHAQEFNQ